MRIEVNQFGSQGEVRTSFVELSQEQIQEIVKRAHEVARLRQQGQPLDAVLDSLSNVLTESQVLAAAPAKPREASAALPVTTGLVDAFAALRASARPSTAGDGTAVVSQVALDAVGEALRAAVDGGGVQEWKWKRVAAPAVGGQEVHSYDLQKVLEKMSQAALGGAPTVREAFTNHPLLFCQAIADLVAQDERMSARDAHATTVVHLDNGDPISMVTLGAPAGMSELDVRAAVQAAVVSAGDYAGIPQQLVGAGFEPIEQITVSVPAPPADDFNDEPEAPR